MVEVVTKFEAYLVTERRVSKNTLDAYMRDLAQFIEFVYERKTSLEQITEQTIKQYLAFLKRRKIATRSFVRKIASLKAFFSYAHETMGWKNFAQDFVAPRIEKSLPRFLTEQEIEQLFHILDTDASPIGLRNKLMIHLLYVSGMRITELTQIKVASIQYDTGFITIDGKGNQQRMVPLPTATMQLIQQYVQTVHEEIAKKYNCSVPYLFSIRYGGLIKPISRQLCWGIVKKLCKSAGIERNISPHQLRHSLATHLLKKGVDLRSLQLWLGHKNLTTVQIYTHVDTQFLRTMYDKKHPRS